MMGQPAWYWLIFAGAVLLIGAFPIAERLERRQDQRDREAWDAFRGPRRGL